MDVKWEERMSVSHPHGPMDIQNFRKFWNSIADKISLMIRNRKFFLLLYLRNKETQQILPIIVSIQFNTGR